ncbi:MAG: hypothetical protein KDD56_05550 [Bdellovibrionales bacterium]|nr:hypothetical protein [Bdellovibrionales bacterium]
MKNNKTLQIIFGMFVLSLVSFQVFAEDLATLQTRFNEYMEKQNYPKALEELNWIKKEVENQNAKKVQGFFTDSLAGMSGQELKANNALGFTSIERVYTGNNNSIKVSLTGGSSSGANNPFGGLAAIGQMAAMMGGQAGMDSFRVKGRTASYQAQGNTGELTVFLDSGSILKFGNADKDTLVKLAEEFPLEGLDNYLKGAA